MSLGVVRKTRSHLYCSFCGKRDDEVGYLVAGPQVFICNECVELCREIGQNLLSENAADVAAAQAALDEGNERGFIKLDDLRKQVQNKRNEH